MNPFMAGVRFQYWSFRRGFDELGTFITTPLFAVIFGGIVVSRDRPDLLPAATMGAVLVGMWTLCMNTGGNIIESERWNGTFEVLESSPARLRDVVLGRVTTITAMTLLTVPEVWLVTVVVFHEPVTVPHVGLFLTALLLTVVGLHATTVLLAGMFVLARNARIFQNFMAYPVYLLGGLVIPVSELPAVVQPLARVVFLSWGSDLLRAALRDVPVSAQGGKLVGLIVTVALTAVIAHVLFAVVLRRARVHGSLSLA